MVERSGSLSRTVLAAVRSALDAAIRRPVVAILILAGIGDIVSGDPVVHGSALMLVAAAIALDAQRGRAHGLDDPETGAAAISREAAAPVVPFRPALLLAAIAFALVVGAFARYSWPATIAVVVPATAGVALAWRTPAGRTDPGPIEPRGAWAWAGLFVVLGFYELMNLLLQPSLTRGSPEHPTISVLLDPALASHAGRTAFLAAWLAVGWFFIER